MNPLRIEGATRYLGAPVGHQWRPWVRRAAGCPVGGPWMRPIICSANGDVKIFFGGNSGRNGAPGILQKTRQRYARRGE